MLYLKGDKSNDVWSMDIIFIFAYYLVKMLNNEFIKNEIIK